MIVRLPAVYSPNFLTEINIELVVLHSKDDC
jgi:hypothetical protein